MTSQILWIVAGSSMLVKRRRRTFNLADASLDDIDFRAINSKFEEAEVGCDTTQSGMAIPQADDCYTKVIGVAIVTFSHSYSGLLAQSSLEERVSAHYYGNAKEHLVYFKVDDVVEIKDALDIIHMGGRGTDNALREVITAMTHQNVQNNLEQLDMNGKQIRTTVEQGLRRYRRELR